MVKNVIRYVPLQRKIGLAILATFVVITVVFGIVLVFLQRLHIQDSTRRSEQYLKMLVEREAEPLANELFEKRLRAVELRIRGILGLEGILSVTVYDAHGSSLAHLDRAGKEVPEESQKVLPNVTTSKTEQTVWGDIPALLYQAPILAMGVPLGSIRIGYSMAAVERERRIFYVATGGLLAITFVLMLVVLNKALAVTVSRPITALKDAMQRIEVEGPGEIISAGHRDEIGDLIAAFNRMSGQLRAMFDTVQREVSERKEAEETARRLRNYLANIINSMPSVLVGVDKRCCVTQWNAAAEGATGISAEEAEGQPLEWLLPMLGDLAEGVRQAMLARTVKTDAKVPRNVDGETRYNDITIYPLMGDEVEGAVIRVDDVTERVRIEEMMVQSEKMLSIGGLAAGMAHEINNPLGVILQASQNVLRRVSSELPANVSIAQACGTTLDVVQTYLEQREIPHFLEDIRESGLRAAQIVENMLSFSRKPDAEGSSTNLANLLDRTLLLAESDYDLKRRYDFRQIEIIREYHPDAAPVICRASKIQQVFLNILRNGAESMMETRDSGRVPRFVLRTLPDGSMVRVEIEDNGPGMDEITCKRVFEPFFTTKPPGVGTGLGMSVSYFIITQEHGGTLSVRSRPGEGSCFIIKLPLEGYPHEQSKTANSHR